MGATGNYKYCRQTVVVFVPAPITPTSIPTVSGDLLQVAPSTSLANISQTPLVPPTSSTDATLQYLQLIHSKVQRMEKKMDHEGCMLTLICQHTFPGERPSSSSRDTEDGDNEADDHIGNHEDADDGDDRTLELATSCKLSTTK